MAPEIEESHRKFVSLRLQAFDFDIVHRNERSHVVSDAFSRLVPDLGRKSEQDAGGMACLVTADIVSVESLPLDKWYNKMLKLVDQYLLCFSAWRIEGFQLFKYSGESSDETESDRWRRVIPKDLRIKVLHENHDNPISGHLGVYKTYHRINLLYYWPRMKNDVARYVRRCKVCQSNKPAQHAPFGLMSSHPKVTELWQMWSIDIVGPLPRSSSGYLFILVICDYFSKFPLFLPLRKATAKAVVKIVEENIMLFFSSIHFV